jgi:hypothetical protein
MPRRVSLVLLIALLLSCISLAKKKNKQELPNLVLNAQTVLVVIHPDAGEPLTNPTANRRARENVEAALAKWGRFRLVTSPQTADLVIAVRKGHAPGPAIGNSPADDRPVIFQPNDGDVRIGNQQGRQPPVSSPVPGQNRGPHINNEIGPSEDTFEVYLGGVQYPLDSGPIWRYMGKDALDVPTVPAVSQFQKAIDESEKQRQIAESEKQRQKKP